MAGLDPLERAFDLSKSSLDACPARCHAIDEGGEVVGELLSIGAVVAPEVFRRATQTLEASFDTRFGNVRIRKRRSGARSQVGADQDELRRDGFEDHRSSSNSIR